MGTGTTRRETKEPEFGVWERTEELVMGPQLQGRGGLEDTGISEGGVCSVEEASRCLAAQVAPRCLLRHRDRGNRRGRRSPRHRNRCNPRQSVLCRAHRALAANVGKS